MRCNGDLSSEWHQFNCDSVNIMVIVMPTRSDLRDEFAMVDEVFALSPLSARPAQPSEADYEAIRDAFMETSRGRWFLGEYAKRNRNADTSMVLDAVARIEHALATQRQQQQEQQLADDNVLPEALAAIRRAVDDATLAAAAAVEGLALAQNLAPVRKGARIIREISWRWREIGADSRICDLIDSQLAAIEVTCDQLVNADPRALLGAAFDIIKARLAEFDHAETTQPAAAHGDASEQPSVATSSAKPAAPPVKPAATTSIPAVDLGIDLGFGAAGPMAVESASAEFISGAFTAGPAASAEAAMADVIVGAIPPAMFDRPAETVAAPAHATLQGGEPAALHAALDEHAELSVDTGPTSAAAALSADAAADAHDEAILELIATEMAAPDPIEQPDTRPSTINLDIEEPIAVDDDIVATFPEPAARTPAPELPAAAVLSVVQPAPVAAASAPIRPAATAARPRVTAAPAPTPIRPVNMAGQPGGEAMRPAPPAAAVIQPLSRPAQDVSLGSTLLANGLVQRQPAPANDPLTPIRRMTQPEKIAFFS
jgi:hypothetical protein